VFSGNGDSTLYELSCPAEKKNDKD